MKSLLLFLLPLYFFVQTGHAQNLKQGLSVVTQGTTNLKAVEAFEKSNPGMIIRQKRVPNPHYKKDVPIIKQSVPAGIPTFGGKISSVGSQLSAPSSQRTQEFPCVNFRALDDDGTAFPPDVNGAAGFEHLMTTLNSQVRIQNKQGVVISTVSLVGFWNGLGGHTDIFDPKVHYDPFSRRWMVVCCATRQAAGSALLLAVSQNADPTGTWNTYSIDADGANLLWLDYPSIGFNRNWITVGGYMFNNPALNNTQTNRVWVINKATVYAGNAINPPFFDVNDAFHISPAITYSATENTQWLVSTFNSNFNNNGFFRLYTITGTAAAPVFTVGNVVNVGPSWGPNNVDGRQQTSAAGINLGDDRTLQSAFRGGTLWVGNNAYLPAANPTTCAAQIVAINTTTNTAVENIRTTANTDGSVMQAYPSFTVNRNNDIFFGYSTFRENAFATATISYRRNDGQGFFFYHYKAGEDWYVEMDNLNRNRWGDYSSTLIDPEDDLTAWTIQEYARPRVGFTSNWGTWWAKICPGIGSCGTDFVFGSPFINIMAKYEATNTITSTTQVLGNSHIKFDAGVRVRLSPGFKAVAGSRFEAYIEGCGGAR